MIKSFKHKGLQKFFEEGSVKGIQVAHKQKIRMRLVTLDTAINLDDIDLPGLRLHSLKGPKKGLWAIDVSKGVSPLNLLMVMHTLLIMRTTTNEYV